MELDLLQLRYFRTAAKRQHLTQAARELRVAQPSLSRSIARLEQELGVSLFDREGRGLRLNESGRAFLRRVEKLFAELEDGIREAQDLARAGQAVIRLAVSVPRILPDLLAPFRALHPDVRFRQSMLPTSRLEQALTLGEVDLVFSTVPPKAPDIVWTPLLEEPIYLVVPASHRLADRQAVRLVEAADEGFVSLHEGYGFRQLTDDFCRQAGFEPNIAFEGDQLDVMAALVTQGLGVAFVPALTWRQTRQSGVRRLRIVDPDCKRTIGLAWSKTRYRSRAAERFGQFVIDYFAQMQTDL